MHYINRLLLGAIIPLLCSSSLCAQTPASDDFSGSTLNTSLWTVFNPVGNGSISLSGGELRLSVPAASVHDVWSSGNNSVRIMQPVSNADFELVTKFDSVFTRDSQMQGIIVEQDLNTFLRFDFRSDNTGPRLFAASISGGAGTFRIDIPLNSALAGPLWLKVRRVGNTWTESWSNDGTSYTLGGTFSFTLTANKVGLFAGNYGNPASAAPAAVAVVDYFYNTANFPVSPDLRVTKSHTGSFTPGSTGAYTIVARNSGTANTAAAVTVTDTLPTGLTAASITGTGWTCRLTPAVSCTRSDALAAGASYPALTLTVNVAANAASSVTNNVAISGGAETNTYNDTASDVTLIGASASPPVSDGFSGSGLNTQLWTFVNPVGNGSNTVSGGDLRLTVPAGSVHDVWSSGNNSARVMQPVSNLDFEVAVKFDSAVTLANQMQGVIVEQDSNTFLRFDFRNDGVRPRLFAASIAGGNGSFLIDVPLSTSVVPPLWLKVKRVGNSWTESWSPDGVTYTSGGTFSFALTANKIGLFAGNYGSPASAAPALTALVDLFSNTASPLSPDLTITKTHTGSFTQGASGKYAITVSNSGGAATAGTVTVTDQVPSGLTATAFSGTGWTCSISPAVSCSRSDALAAGAGYPGLTLTVAVSSGAPPTVTNSVSVSGGGETNTANDTATDATSIAAPLVPDLTITKTHTGTFTQGGTGTYSITAKNSGTAATSGPVTVTDSVPPGLAATAFSGTGWMCSLTSGVTCTRTDALAAGASYAPLTLSVNVAANAPASVTNMASVAGGGETNTSNDTASDVSTISGAPDLSIIKVHTGNFAAGGTGTYTISVSNVGRALTTGVVTVTDTVPPGLTATAFAGTGWTCALTPAVNCTRSDGLAPGSSYPVLTLSVNIASNSPASVTNTAAVSGGGETNTSNDTASDATTINSVPDLTITKSHTDTFIAGGAGTYTISAVNSGNAPTFGAVTVTDNVPVGLTATALSGTGWTCALTPTVSCSRSDVLPAGASYPVLTLSVNVATNAPASVTNTVTVAGGGEANTSNDTASDPTTIGSVPDLTITKAHTGNFLPGLSGSYTISVSNIGTAPTTGLVTMTDMVPTGLTAATLSGTGWTCALTPTVNCTRSDSLATGASYPALTLTVGIDSNAPLTVTNTATVAGGGETNTSNDSASDVTAIGSVPDLVITKSHTGTFTAGGTGTYTISVTNSGNAPTSDVVTVTDTMPTGLTAMSIAGTGWMCSLTPTVNCTRSDVLAAANSYPLITLTASVALNAPATVTNTATVAGGGQTNTSNDTASDPTAIAGVPDLVVSKTHTGTFTSGGTGQYKITVGNAGTALTQGAVTVTDNLPAGLTATALSGTGWVCTVTPGVSCTRNDALAAGASFPALTLAVGVAANAPASVTNIVTVAGGGESNTSNDTASDVTAIGGVPDLTVTKTHTGNFTAGGTGTYSILVANSGNAPTSGTVTVTDTLPSGLTAMAFSGSAWTCALSPSLNCSRSDAIAAGASYPSLTLAINVASNAPASVTNTATVAGGGEANTGNDSASDITAVTAASDLTITKTHSGNFSPGGTGTYTIAASNSGNASTSGAITVTDSVPAGLTAAAFSGMGWTCALTPAVICSRYDVLAAGASFPALSLTVDVATNAPSTVTNTASVAGGGEVNTSNNTASDVTTIGSVPDLTISKSHTGAFLSGGTGAYTITVGNVGSAATTGLVTVTDAVPNGLTPTSLTGTGWSCALTPAVNCTRNDAVAAGASYPPLMLNVAIDSNAPPTLTNVVSVTGGGNVNTSNDTASDVTTIGTAPDLTVTKSHAGNFVTGGTGTYTITVTNSGNAATSGAVNVTDAIPSGLSAAAFSGTGWTCALTPTVSCTRNDVLAPQSSYPPLTLTVGVAGNVPGSVTNTVIVDGGGETNTSNNSSSDVTGISGVPDLTVSKTHTGTFPSGGTGLYTINVSNVGTALTAGTVSVTDTLPSGVTANSLSGTGWACALTPTVNCTRSDALAAGASYPSIALGVSVAGSAPASVTNSVTVAGGGETNISNDSAADVTAISTAPDLTVTKRHSGNFIQGGTGTYSITATNSGNTATSGTVTITDTVPAGLTATAFAGTGWACALTPTVNCTRADALAAAGSYPALTLTVNVAANAPASVTNTVTVAGGGETNTSNNTASDLTTVNSVPDLTITKTHAGNFTQGGTGTYTITATNSGSAVTSGTVTVTDTLPTGLTATAFSGTGWTCALTPAVACTRADALAAAASYPALTLAVNIAPNLPASVTNVVTVAGGGELNTSNDTASDLTTISGAPDLTLTKTHSGNFTQGGTGTYTITATNSGSAPTSGTVTVTDTVPSGLTATAFAGPGWTCTLTPTVNCTRSDALAAATSYPPLTLSVIVAGNAPASVTNLVAISGGGETNTVNDTASDPTVISPSSPPISDDFHSPALNSALWTLESPVGDVTLRTTGTNILISLPAGRSHDAWTTNESVRIVQSVPNGDFSVEALFQSSVTAQYQSQGIIAEQDNSTFTRVDIYSDGSQTRLFAASISAGSAIIWLDDVIPTGTWPLYLRVTRTGNNWTSSWSSDGTTYNAGASFTYAMTVNKLGPFAGNSGSAAPAFTASVDYFMNRLSPISPEDGGLPGIVTISSAPTSTGAVITWVTDTPATSKVDYGLTTSYGSSTTADNTLLTGHRTTLSGLTCGTSYNYRVISSDAGSKTSSSSNQTFTTGSCASAAPVSDDFSGGTLNPIVWTFVNPLNDGGTATVSSSGISLDVPGGNAHDVWTGANNSVRIMQTISDADFDVEVKFTSAVSTSYQMQGLIVEQDSANFLRFDVLFGNCEAAVFAANFAGGNPTVWLNNSIHNGANVYMRLTRTGNNWAFSTSYDGRRWTSPFKFVRALNVSRIGPFAGNAGVNGAPSPAFTSVVNYFINRQAPPATVHGQPYPGVPVTPSINLFYGNNQTFGQKGIPQQWVNILGNVAAFHGLSSLNYTLNGGSAQNLWTGENQFRLVEPGDFNMEIDYASLQPGANSVLITATDTIGNLATQSVTVTKITGQTWPANYTIDWSTAGTIQNVAQVIDGQWQIQADGTVRPLQIGGASPVTGYDRLIAFGDSATWQNYDVTAQVTINSHSCHDFGVGFVVGWHGHTTNQYGTPLPDQPRTGHPFPGLLWYSMEPNTASAINIYTNTDTRIESRLAQDTATQLVNGVTYTYRFRVGANTLGGSHYSYKVWKTGQPEPANWGLEVDGELSRGSIVIGLHKTDASIGKIVVTGF